MALALLGTAPSAPDPVEFHPGIGYVMSQSTELPEQASSPRSNVFVSTVVAPEATLSNSALTRAVMAAPTPRTPLSRGDQLAQDPAFRGFMLGAALAVQAGMLVWGALSLSDR